MKLNKSAVALKKQDPILGEIINKNLKPLKDEGTVYDSLIGSIISQQISVSAATSIKNKFLKAFGNEKFFPSAKIILKAEDEYLRSLGLSPQKVGYIKNVARHFEQENLHEKDFDKMSNEEIIADLTKIKGVGEWTVEMILMFRLGRKDVFSVKDLGLLNAIYKLYKINPKKYNPKNLKKKVLKISQAWAPHRTLACRYLWDYKDKK
jgi:DNA-3-methyladenine glycosylase II